MTSSLVGSEMCIRDSFFDCRVARVRAIPLKVLSLGSAADATDSVLTVPKNTCAPSGVVVSIPHASR
eukprot:2191517-Prorocentrum_lima.AAC.1